MFGMSWPVSLRRSRPARLAAVALLGLGAFAILHAPAVRARVLALLVARLSRSGIVAHVDRLDYNLARLDMRLYRVTLATTDAAATPFLTADEVHAVGGWGILRGRLSVARVELAHPRVVLTRNAAGEPNWPVSSERSSAAFAIHLGRVRIPDLDVTWRDAVTASHVEIAGVSLDLTPAGGTTSGSVRMNGPGRLQWNDRRTTIDALEGRLAWNSYDLAVEAFSVAVPEGRVRTDGRADSLLANPRLDLHVGAEAGLAALARWIPIDRPVAGAIHLDARVTGNASDPAAVFTLTGRDIEAGGVGAIGVEAAGRFADGRADVSALTARVAGGAIRAHAQASIAGGPGTIHVDWRALDLATLLQPLLGREGVQLAAHAAGSLDMRWSSARLDALSVHGEGRIAAPAGAIGERLPLDGSIAFDLQNQRWTLRAEQTIGGDARVTSDIAGGVDRQSPSRSPLLGNVRVRAPDLTGLTRTLGRAGLLRAGAIVHGTAHGDFSLRGTIGEPRLEGVLEASQLRYEAIGPAALRTRALVTRARVTLDDIEAKSGRSSARGQALIAIDTGRVDGQFDASLKQLSELAGIIPPLARPDGALDVHGSLSGSLTSPILDATLTSEGIDAAGQHVDRLDAHVRSIATAIAIDHLRARSGSGQFDAHGRVDLARRTYAVQATATGFPIRPVPGENGLLMFPIAGSLTAHIDGDGSFDNLRGRGQLVLADTTWANVTPGRVEADVTAAGRRVSIDLRAPDLALTGSADVGVSTAEPLSARGRFEPADLAAIAQRLGWQPPFPLAGSASVGFEIAGRPDRPGALHVKADLEKLSVDIDRQAVRLADPAGFEYDGPDTLRVRHAALSVATSTLTIDGALGEPGSTGLDATLHGPAADFAFLRHLGQPASAADHADLPPPSGTLDLRLTANGPLTSPVVAGSFHLDDGRIPLSTAAVVTETSIAARYDLGVLIVDDLRAAFQGATLAASGRVPADLFRDRLPPRWRYLFPQTGARAHLTARLSSLTSEVAAPFVDAATLEAMKGHVDAAIELDADRPELARVEGTVVLTRADLSLSGVSFDQQTPTKLQLHGGRADIAAWDWGRGGNRVVLTGGVALGGNRALDITARSTLDLALLNAFVRAGRTLGSADAEIRVGGTVAEPALDGYVTFAQGELRLSNPRLIVTDLTGTVTLDRNALALQQLSATVNGGPAEIAGSMHHRWFRPLDGEVTISARSAAIALIGLRAEADADLTVTIEPRGPRLSGTATLLRGAYREPLSLTGGLLQALRTSATFAQAGPASALDALRLDVHVVTQDDLLVDNNYARLAATADLRVVGTLAQPAMVGRVALTEGGLIFFGGRRYRLASEGSIGFVNTTRIEPDIDLSAVTSVGNTEITLALKGTPATLESTLTSQPLLSRSELVSLLMTGRATAEDAAGRYALGGDERGGYTPGSEELLGYLSGELFGTAGRAVGLDSVRIERGTPDLRFDAGLVATEIDPGARLTFGKNVGRKAQVVFSQSLRDSGGITWIVSYAPQTRIELRAVSLDNGDRLYGFRHDVVLGASSPVSPRPSAPETPRITNVQLAGAGDDEAALRSRLKLDVGDRFSFFRWQDDRERLERFYQEHDHVQARVAARRTAVGSAGSGAGGVELLYDVRPGPRTALLIAGVSLSSRAIDAMKHAWMDAVVDQFLIEEITALARGELVDRGFVHASVAATLEGDAAQKTLRIDVDPGLHADRREIVFAGNSLVPAATLEALVAAPALTRAVWIEPDRVRDAVTAFYRSRGFLNAAVTIGPISTIGDRVTRPIDVAEGEPFRVRDVRVDGAHASSPDEIRRLSALAPGAPFSEQAIERARLAITESYRARGFNAFGVTLRTEAPPGTPAVVDVAIAVDEGPQQRVRDVTIAGLVRTRPAIVRRALALDAGGPVNLAEWSNARRRLYETGVFRSVDIQPEPMSAPPTPVTPDVPAEQPVRAKVTLSEWPPFRLRYGLEVNDRQSSPSDSARSLSPESATGNGRTFGLGLASDISARNVFGNAISVGLAGRYTRDFRAARAYATAPSFFGSRIESTLFVSRSREEIGQAADATTGKFVTDAMNLTLEQRVRPAAQVEITYRYSFERNHTFDRSVKSLELFPFDVEANVARLASTVLVDTRDDLVDATRGWFHSSDLEYGPSALGSDLRFAKYLAQQRYFHRISGVVLATAARVGLAKGFGGQLLIPSERFFAGGGNSVRGYSEDALSPRDAFGDIVGGNALLIFNGEARFPIYRMVRGVGFVDAGRAFETIGSMTLKGLRAGTGIGLRVQTPIVLLRFDVAIALDRALSVGQRRPSLFFSIGQAF